MKFTLIQLLDCEGEAIGLYAFNENQYTLDQATALLDSKYSEAKEQLNEANGEEGYYGPSDVQEYIDEALSDLGIEHVSTNEHYSSEF